MDMTADVPVILNVERYGSRGWSFWVQWPPRGFKRQFRTSTSGRGLSALYGATGWSKCRWLAQDYLWPRDRAGFEKQARILLRSGNYPTHKL